MDEKTKQKVMIGVLAVLALGWGTYTFVLKDSGESEAANTTQGPFVRKTHSKPAVDVKKSTRKARAPRKVKADTKVTRKERRARDTSGTTRKTRRGRKINVKQAKKTLAG